jgi:hypothetical protein
VTLFAGVDLVHAASPRAETAIMVRAIFFTDFSFEWLRVVARRTPLRWTRRRMSGSGPSSGPPAADCFKLR